MSPTPKRSAPKKAAAKKVGTAPKAARAKTQAASPKTAERQPGKSVYMNREERWRMVAEAAYHKAEARGFAAGHEVEDWLAAERDIDAVFGGKR